MHYRNFKCSNFEVIKENQADKPIYEDIVSYAACKIIVETCRAE